MRGRPCTRLLQQARFASASPTSKLPCYHHLEVERKFAPTPASLASLRSNTGDPPFKAHTHLGLTRTLDAYFDTEKSTLMARGVYVRLRNGTWEAKMRRAGDYVTSAFAEVRGETAVHGAVRDALRAGTEDGGDVHALACVARFATLRERWMCDGFEVVVDEADFGHRVGEVECCADVEGGLREGEEDAMIAKMGTRIDEFMGEHTWAFPEGEVEGKLIPVAGAVAGIAATAAYLDAKYHIRKDIRTIRWQRSTERNFALANRKTPGNLWHWFEAQVQRLPSTEEAIWSRAGCYTWTETYANACRYGQYFLQNGITPGSHLTLCLTNRPEFVFALLGAWAVGAAPAMINPNLAGNALIHCLKVAGGKLLIVDDDVEVRRRIEDVRERLEGELGLTIRVLDTRLKGEILRIEPTRPADDLRCQTTGTFPMCLFFTSGTTGHPKACPFEAQRAGNLAGRAEALGLSTEPDGERWYICMPLYHGTGLTSVVACILSGMTMCIGKKFSSSNFWTDVRDSKATVFVYVGETARYLLASPPSELDKRHGVKVMFGNGMRPDVWHRFVERFGIETVAEFFASTEGVFALLNTSRGPFSATAVGHHGILLRRILHDAYIPVELDHETNAVRRDPRTGFALRKRYEEGGEILVRLPNEAAFVGYYGNPKATAEKFERNVFKKGDLYYRTGDALRRDEQGRWHFVDRLGDTFRWKSENVSTAEVSEVLGTFPGIVEANVYGVEVPGHDGRAGCAALYVDPEQLARLDFDALLQHARARLPRYAVPVFIRILSKLSAMHNNKQNKVPLRNDGIDWRKIKERAEAEASKDDRGREQQVVYDTMLWNPASLSQLRGGKVPERYVHYNMTDWEGLQNDVPHVAKL